MELPANLALETNRIAAKLAYAQHKYDEAWTSTKFLLVNSAAQLSSDEILLVANVVDAVLPGLREELCSIITSTEEVEELVRNNLELELLSLADLVIPHIIRQIDPAEEKAILQRVLADFYAIVASYHSDEDVRRNARTMALHNYHTSVLKCDKWKHGEPQQIRAAINYATFCENNLQEHDQALTLLTMAFKRVMSYKAANEQEQKETTELLKLIRTNLVTWFPEDEEEKKESS